MIEFIVCCIRCPAALETHGYDKGVDEPALLALEYWAQGGCELEGWKRAVFCEVLHHGQGQGVVKQNEPAHRFLVVPVPL